VTIDRFALPIALALILAAPLVLTLLLRRGRSTPLTLALAPSADDTIPSTWRTSLRWVPAALRAIALALLAVAIARPQSVEGRTQTSTEGIAIQIVVDRSGSMREGMPTPAGDARKMDVVKQVLLAFIAGNEELGLKGRDGDLVGLIGFARYADTLSPLIRAHEPLIQLAKDIDTVTLRAEDGTGIGDALALAAARLKSAEEEVLRARKNRTDDADPDFRIKSKVIVLITDGLNNAGSMDPDQAAALAKEWGVKIYAIGVGGQMLTVNSPFGPRRIPVGSSFDDAALRRIADATGGRAFIADSAAALVDVVREIDSLERSAIRSVEHVNTDELFMPLAIAALVALGIELALANLVFRSLP
jgi:Ca-activated chloride channel family protein